MENVYFKPFIGENYKNAEQKIMMLGESHYLWDEDQTPENSYEWGSDLNNSVISAILEGIPHTSQQTFYNAKAIITGDYHSDNKEFWNDVIFYNYLQGFVGNAALSNHRDKRYLNEEMIEKSRKALFEMLEKYTPNLVIVWGKDESKIWSWMPTNNWSWIDKDLILWKYDEKPNILFWNIQHPSVVSYDAYHQDFQKVKSYL